jgi:hypothetical protein
MTVTAVEEQVGAAVMVPLEVEVVLVVRVVEGVVALLVVLVDDTEDVVEVEELVTLELAVVGIGAQPKQPRP